MTRVKNGLSVIDWQPVRPEEAALVVGTTQVQQPYPTVPIAIAPTKGFRDRVHPIPKRKDLATSDAADEAQAGQGDQDVRIDDRRSPSGRPLKHESNRYYSLDEGAAGCKFTH
jgi:hypothetical protein